ncbi:hypothetical protein FOCC_FOCC002423, partial [Frankliniella occidentalis]
KSGPASKQASRDSIPADPKSTPRKNSSSHTSTPQTKQTPQRKSIQGNQKTTNDVSRRTRRFKNGTKALREIKALQRSTSLLIPKFPFSRLVREIMNSFSYHQLRVQSSALEALQEAAEMYMVQFFEDSLLCTLHAKRVTLMPADCHLMRRLRGPSEVCNK